MFKNVLVGVDGGPNGRDAIALATRLLSPGGRLTLLNARPLHLSIMGALTPGLLEEERDASERMLSQERGRAHVKASLVSVKSDSPGAALHVQAEKQRADLLVVGSCSRGPVGRVVMGDDARQALNGAPCAVAVAPRGFAEVGKPLTRVGVAFNGSPESYGALEVAHEIADSAHATVAALEVIGIPAYGYAGMVAVLQDTVEEILADASKRMGELPGVDGRAVYGLAGEELAAFGDEVDILVVGSRGYGPLRRLVAGSTSLYLEHHARCALLILPRGTAPDGHSEDEHEEHLAGARA